MKKKALLILGIVIAATLGVVLIVQPGQDMKKDQHIQLPGIEGQQSVYFRVQLKGQAQVADFMAKGVAKMPNSGRVKVTADALPVPITDDIAISFPGYKIRRATMVVAKEVTTYEVVLVKIVKTKTLVYEVYTTIEAAQAVFGSFIVKKR